MILQDVVNERVDVVANCVDLCVDVVQIDLVRGHLIFLGQRELVVLGCLILLIHLTACNLDSLRLQLHFKLDAVGQLVKLCLNTLLSDHFRDDRLGLGSRNVQLLAHGLIRDVQVDTRKNQNIMLEQGALENGVAVLSYGFLMILQLVILKLLRIRPFDYRAKEQLAKKFVVRINLFASLVLVQCGQQPIFLVSCWSKHCTCNCRLEHHELILLAYLFLVGDAVVLPGC